MTRASCGANGRLPRFAFHLPCVLRSRGADRVQCRRLVRERKKLDVKRGYCEAVQEALETYLESTGNQLAEAMGVSFSGELGPRLSQQPYKMQGEEGVRKMVTMQRHSLLLSLSHIQCVCCACAYTQVLEALSKNEYDASHISQGLSTWASGWLLHATANDQQPRGGGGLPPNFDVEALKRQMQDGKAPAAAGAEGEAPDMTHAGSSGPTNDAIPVDGSDDL